MSLAVEHVKLGRGKAVAAVLRLDRPESLNAIDWDMLRAVDAALDDVAANPDVRCVLVTGNGRAFSAGGDLKGYQTLQRDREAFTRFVSELHRVFGRLMALKVPAATVSCSVATAVTVSVTLTPSLGKSTPRA